MGHHLVATILWCQHISTTHEPVIGWKTGWSSRDMYQSVSCIEGDGINLKLLVNSLSAGPKVIGHSSSVHSLLDIPSSKLTVCYGKWSIEIDDLPTKNGDFPVRKLLVYREKCYVSIHWGPLIVKHPPPRAKTCSFESFDLQNSSFISKKHPKTVTHRIHVCYIYGNIYHQYTPNVSIYIYIPYMDPVGNVKEMFRSTCTSMDEFKRWALCKKLWLSSISNISTSTPWTRKHAKTATA